MQKKLFIVFVIVILATLVFINWYKNYVKINSNTSCEFAESIATLNPIEKVLTQNVSVIANNENTTIAKFSLYLGLGKIEIYTEGCGKGNIIKREIILN